MLDVGANADARASHLVQFAYLGSAFAAAVLGVERPRVALLSVGEEDKKGSQLVVEAHALAARTAPGSSSRATSRARDLLSGEADVVVTDGFTGNVTLKTIEGTAKAVAEAVRAAARSGPRAAAGGLLLRGALGGLRQRLDPDQTGGRDPARAAWRRGRRPRLGRPGGDRQPDPARGASGRAGCRRADGRAARDGGVGRSALRRQQGDPVDGTGES